MKNMSTIVRMGLVLTTLMTAAVGANTIPIAETAGTGNSSAFVAINFSDGAKYNFQVFFDGAPTGEQMLETLDAETGLQVFFSDFGYGRFADGFAYDDHSDVGYALGENWWHYWAADSVNLDGKPNWVSPKYGCSARTLTDGDWEGWVYGNAVAPAVPEPATFGLAALGIFFLRNRSRKLS